MNNIIKTRLKPILWTITFGLTSITATLYAQPNAEVNQTDIHPLPDQTAKAQARSAEKDAQDKRRETINQLSKEAITVYRSKIDSVWTPPMGSAGESAIVYVILRRDGRVSSIRVTASNADMKASAEKAVRDAAPYPVPNDPEIFKRVLSFKMRLDAR